MPNNFEKQVKEKMDELNFVPTAPVWEHIEKQIRAKKDRRRFFLWLPLIILITGTGTWLLHNSQNKNEVRHSVAIQSPAIKEILPNYKNETIRENNQGQGSKHSHGNSAPIINDSRKINEKNTYATNTFRKAYTTKAPLQIGLENRKITHARFQPQQGNDLSKDREPGIGT